MGAITDTLKRAIRKGGNNNAVAKACGIEPASLLRFMRGDSGLSLDNVERVCARFGLELRETQRRTSGRK